MENVCMVFALLLYGDKKANSILACDIDLGSAFRNGYFVDNKTAGRRSHEWAYRPCAVDLFSASWCIHYGDGDRPFARLCS